MSERPTGIRETDDAARATARAVLLNARTAALGFTDPDHGVPGISRIGFAMAENGEALTLVSDLSLHTRALRVDPRAALLVGEPAPKGDPLNSPRLSLRATASFVPADSADFANLRQVWLAQIGRASCRERV